MLDNAATKLKPVLIKGSPTIDNFHDFSTHVKSLEGYYATTTPTMLGNALTSRAITMTIFFFSTIDRGRTKTYNSSTATTRNASYGNRTHVNSLEGYYATTTPTMLDNAATKLKPVLIKGSPDDNFCLQHPWHQEQSQWQYFSSALLTEEEPKLTIHRPQQQEMHRTGIEPMSIAWNYATTTPTMLQYWNLYWSLTPTMLDNDQQQATKLKLCCTDWRAVPMTIFVFSTLDIKSNHNDKISL